MTDLLNTRDLEAFTFFYSLFILPEEIIVAKVAKNISYVFVLVFLTCYYSSLYGNFCVSLKVFRWDLCMRSVIWIR